MTLSVLFFSHIMLYRYVDCYYTFSRNNFNKIEKLFSLFRNSKYMNNEFSTNCISEIA